ncbi:helix-turn-helix transcriptional regulator [Zhongshania aliphaticivorans]|uniref:helix-turn-helix transcriptional regulator n=1 Tax=Zhongshania aliphaticivorans TaxID=1470434 RepID=UPI0013304940|nr:helix-turn-helix transcriptional regulator [Zhongshania aliphaticivorans]
MNFSIEMTLRDKLKLLRKAEGLSQQELCDLVDVPQSTLAKIENGRNKSTSVDFLNKISSHPRLVKYAIWLMFDQITEAQALDALEFLKSLPEYVEPPEGD